MLNRNNLTLSALSNRLNLGTRSLVLTTSVDNNGNALRLRHTHHDVMRKSMDTKPVTSIPVEVYAIPPVTGPAYADAAAFTKACGGSWKPGAADASLVPTPAETWRNWQASQTAMSQGRQSGSSSRLSSRSRRSAANAGRVEARLRPVGRCLQAIEDRNAAWTSRAEAARRTAIAAAAE